MIYLAFVLVVLAWAVVSFVRVEIVYRHIDRRIKEVYASKNWYKYEIDIVGTYNLALWDYRKWSYKAFFPEDVV